MTMADIGPSSLCPQPTLSEAEPPSLSAIDPTHETAQQSKHPAESSPNCQPTELNCDRNKR